MLQAQQALLQQGLPRQGQHHPHHPYQKLYQQADPDRRWAPRHVQAGGEAGGGDDGERGGASPAAAAAVREKQSSAGNAEGRGYGARGPWQDNVVHAGAMAGGEGGEDVAGGLQARLAAPAAKTRSPPAAAAGAGAAGAEGEGAAWSGGAQLQLGEDCGDGALAVGQEASFSGQLLDELERDPCRQQGRSAGTGTSVHAAGDLITEASFGSLPEGGEASAARHAAAIPAVGEAGREELSGGAPTSLQSATGGMHVPTCLSDPQGLDLSAASAAAASTHPAQLLRAVSSGGRAGQRSSQGSGGGRGVARAWSAGGTLVQAGRPAWPAVPLDTSWLAGGEDDDGGEAEGAGAGQQAGHLRQQQQQQGGAGTGGGARADETAAAAVQPVYPYYYSEEQQRQLELEQRQLEQQEPLPPISEQQRQELHKQLEDAGV